MSLLRHINWIVVLMLLHGVALADESQWLVNDASGVAASSSQVDDGMGISSSIRKVGGGLAVVLGGFFLLTVLLRKPGGQLPVSELMEPLGSVQIAPKVRLHLVRLGARILVLHLSGQSVNRVAEIEDPEEVQKLLATRSSGEIRMPVPVDQLLHDTARAQERGVLR